MPVRQPAPQHPVEIERIIDKLLAKRPEDRYQTAGALRAELEPMKRRSLVSKPAAERDAGLASIAVLLFEIVGAASPCRGSSATDSPRMSAAA